MRNLLCALLVLVGCSSFGQVAVRSLDGQATNLTVRPRTTDANGMSLIVISNLDVRGRYYGDAGLLTNLNLLEAMNYTDDATGSLSGVLTSDLNTASNALLSSMSGGYVPTQDGNSTNQDLVSPTLDSAALPGGLILWTNFPQRVIIAGDSLSIYDVGVQKGWAHYFTNRMSLLGITQALNFAESGRTSSNVWNNYTANITPYAPTTTGIPAALIIMAGINDRYHDWSPELSWSFISNIWRQALAEGFEVVGCSLYPDWNMGYQRIEALSTFNGLMRSQATNINYFVDFAATMWNSGDTNITYDGLHPTSRGGELMARQVEWTLTVGRLWKPLITDSGGGWMRNTNGVAGNPTLIGKIVFTNQNGLSLIIESNSSTMRLLSNTNMTFQGNALIWRFVDMLPGDSGVAQIRITSTNVVIGKAMLTQSTNIRESVIVGAGAALYGRDQRYSTLVGDYSGAGFEGNGDGTTFLGYYSGFGATNANDAVIMGVFAGQWAANGQYATIIGHKAGLNATNSTRSIYLGYQAGQTNNRANTLIIDSQDATAKGANAFIYGELDNRLLKLNASLQSTGTVSGDSASFNSASLSNLQAFPGTGGGIPVADFRSRGIVNNLTSTNAALDAPILRDPIMTNVTAHPATGGSVAVTLKGDAHGSGLGLTNLLEFRRPTKLIAFGDSITWLQLPTFPNSWFYELTNLYSFNNLVSSTNYAINGGKLTNLWNIWDAAVTNAPSAGQDGIAFVMIGANDIGFGDASIGLAGATNFVNSVSNLFDSLHTNGWKVFAFRVMPAWWYLPATRNTTRIASHEFINESISILTNYDWIVYTDVLLPDPGDPSLYYDGTHPTNTASRIIAEAVRSTLEQPSPYRPSLPRTRLEQAYAFGKFLNPYSVGTNIDLYGGVLSNHNAGYAFVSDSSSSTNYFAGKVGIGKVPDNQVLDVNGSIQAQNINLTLSTAPYVFWNDTSSSSDDRMAVGNTNFWKLINTTDGRNEITIDGNGASTFGGSVTSPSNVLAQSWSTTTNTLSSTNSLDMLVGAPIHVQAGTVSISNLLNTSTSETRSTWLSILGNGDVLRVPDLWINMSGTATRAWTVPSGGWAFLSVVCVQGRYTNFACSLDTVALTLATNNVTGAPVTGYVPSVQADGSVAWSSSGAGDVTTAQLNSASNSISASYSNTVDYVSNILRADIGVSSGGPQYPYSTNIVRIGGSLHDDFLYGSTLPSGGGQLGFFTSGNGAGANTGIQKPGEANAPGVIQSETGTTASGQACIYNGASSLYLSDSYFTNTFRFRIIDTNDLVTGNGSFLVLGFGDSLSGVPTDGAYVFYDTNSVYLQYVVSKASTRSTNIVSGLTLQENVWYSAEIVLDSVLTNASFSIDGGNSYTFTNSVSFPHSVGTGLEYLIMARTNQSAADMAFQLDYVTLNWSTVNAR